MQMWEEYKYEITFRTRVLRPFAPIFPHNLLPSQESSVLFPSSGPEEQELRRQRYPRIADIKNGVGQRGGSRRVASRDADGLHAPRIDDCTAHRTISSDRTQQLRFTRRRVFPIILTAISMSASSGRGTMTSHNYDQHNRLAITTSLEPFPVNQFVKPCLLFQSEGSGTRRRCSQQPNPSRPSEHTCNIAPVRQGRLLTSFQNVRSSSLGHSTRLSLVMCAACVGC
jgi:hypothetical protein